MNSDYSSDLYFEAQVAVLGSLMLDPDRVAGMVMHQTRAEDYTGEYRTVFRACQKLFRLGKPIDHTMVQAEIGPQYGPLLQQIRDLTPTAWNCEAYLAKVLEQSKLTRLKELANAMLEEITLESAQQVIGKMNRVIGDRPSVRVVTMEQGFQDFYARQSEPARLIPWGMDKLDDTLRAEPGDFIILGGYPSAGKTAFALQLAWNQAKDRRVGFFSLETNPEKLIDRTVAAVCGVDFGRIKKHSLQDKDWELCEQCSTAFIGRSLELIQAGGLTIQQVHALSLAGRYEVIYLDYLQLTQADNPRATDVEKVTQISIDLHTMAQTTGITICALSQLSRPDKSGGGEKAPGLHSLRQSGQIEQDADGVMLLYKEKPDDPKSIRSLKIAKNKEGRAGGIIHLSFDGRLQRFGIAQDDPEGIEETSPARRTRKKQDATLFDLPDDTQVPF